MNLPSGLIFYLDFKYGNGQQPGSNHSTENHFSVVQVMTLVQQMSAINGLYGDGRFGYSVNDVTDSC